MFSAKKYFFHTLHNFLKFYNYHLPNISFNGKIIFEVNNNGK
nr:MAG TPA: hypothetical protein [Caudoviricetes sp.]